MSQELKKTANKLKKEIQNLAPSRTNISKFKALMQELIDTLIEINSEESIVAKDSLLHLVEQEIFLVEKSTDEESLFKSFNQAQKMLSVDFSGF